MGRGRDREEAGGERGSNRGMDRPAMRGVSMWPCKRWQMQCVLRKHMEKHVEECYKCLRALTSSADVAPSCHLAS